MRLSMIVLGLIALVCPARADDAFRYRQIRFGNALTDGRLSGCSIRFQIAFDARVSPRREDTMDGEIVFSRRSEHPSVAMTMRAFGDDTTKFTGVGRISDVMLTGDGNVLPLTMQDSRTDSAQQALPPDRVADLSAALERGATLGFTLSDPARRFAFPLSLDEAGLSPASGDLAKAGRSIFDACMTALARAPK